MASPFDDKKKEAAKRALMSALEGKGDVLKENADKEAAARLKAAQGGGGGGGGRGGGGGGGRGGDDGKWKKETGTTLQTFAFIVGGLVLFNTWRQLLALIVNIIFIIFRIPRTGPGALEPVDAEASAIDNVSRWASDEDDEAEAGQEKKS